MPLNQALLLVALVAFAIYRQTCTAAVVGSTRFNIALIYAALAGLGVATWGWSSPQGIGWAFLLTGFALSAGAGAARGLLTHLWLSEGQVMRRGTGVTVGLFFVVVTIKVAMGAYARIHGIADGADLGEILVVVAIMSAAQAEIIFRRAQPLAQIHLANGETPAGQCQQMPRPQAAEPDGHDHEVYEVSVTNRKSVA